MQGSCRPSRSQVHGCDMKRWSSARARRRERVEGVSLKTLLLGFTTLLVIILLGLSALLGFQQFRGHVSASQQSQAQNAATALGLSLSSAVDGRDRAAVATYINALFDLGHYQRVVFADPNGDVLVRREAGDAGDGAPQWFRRLVNLPVAEAGAQVMQGWEQQGEVRVVIDPASAYQALWDGSIRSILVFLLVGALAVLLASLGLRLLLRPLGQLERQAELLRKHRFDARVPIPRTRELGGVAIAANHMARELERLIGGQIRLIEDLRSQTQLDPVTGLDNRSSFGQRLRTECESRESASGGCVAMLSLTGFSTFNQDRGYQAGDLLLVKTAQRLREFIAGHPGAFVGRRTGADFGLFLPAANEEDSHESLGRLAADLTVDLTAAGAPEVVVHVGFVPLRPPEKMTEVLSRVDAALARARSQHAGSGVEGMADAGVRASHGGQRWRTLLADALAGERLRLLFQPTFAGNGERLWFDQVLAQVEIDGEWLGAAQFIALVERHGLAPQLDRPVLRATLDHLDSHPGDTLCCVLSTASLADMDFREQMLEAFGRFPQASRRLWVAIHEDAVRQEPDVLGELIPRLRDLGVRVLIDRFGIGGVSFDYLQRWVIDGIRIDRSYVRHLDQRSDARFFVRSICTIARSRSVRVFLAGLESAEEWRSAQALEVDGGMGYFLGRPSLRSSRSG